MKTWKRFLIFLSLIAASALIGLGCSEGDTTGGDLSPDGLERVTQTLVAPPFLPEHDQVAAGPPKVVQIRMVIEEKLIEIDPDGTKIWALTFNGSVPGPMIAVHQNDYVELTLVNPETNTLLHNVDFHAATGAMGAGALTLVNPGEEVVLRFYSLIQGVYFFYIGSASKRY